ncbi:AAA family ATPase [Piscinibacter sp. Jin2]|uniref:RecBCD enzyme subunit RecD n=1 Tax=Aquariibacter lacus TaxID=2801332 RepID=A0A9X0XIE7_9BURK|nr:AAA family ATPase [Piscinibacter lacus]MBL0720523.1 AAA family ATPase [Piscinibacter lacus]
MSPDDTDRPMLLAPPPAAHATLLAELDRWVAEGWLRALDRQFAAFLAARQPDAHPHAILAAALASHQLGRGHACLDLDATLADAGTALALPPDGRPRRPPAAGFRAAAAAIDAAPARPPMRPAQLLAGLSSAAWDAALAHPALLSDLTPAGPGQPAPADPGDTPLVRVGPRLYLRRCWRQEQTLRAALAARLDPVPEAESPAGRAALARALDVLFPPAAAAPDAGPPPPDGQKRACALAARRRFALITGGPGTGKTTTVLRLLVALQHLALSAGPQARPLRIRLAAPTGKAAARLGESIAGAVARLPLDGLPEAERLRAAVPTEVLTVHRLLGARPDTRAFRHDARHPLPLDALVVDEASMLDLETAAALVEALPPGARLILLGDKDQLASVEAGAVLGDLALRADEEAYDADTRAWLHAVAGEPAAAWASPPAAARPAPAAGAVAAPLPAAASPAAGPGPAPGPIPEPAPTAPRRLDQAVALLRTSHRFQAGGTIGRLAETVRRGDRAALQAQLDTPGPGLRVLELDREAPLRRLLLGRDDADRLVDPQAPGAWLARLPAEEPPPGAPPEARAAWARELLEAMAGFQLLAALRSGPQGIETLNERIEALLRAEGLLGPAAGGWYLGRPVMVTRNDPELGLMNGDLGLTLSSAPDPATGRPGGLRVVVPAPEAPGGVRWLHPGRLRAVETVFAMTVHKAQGSEFRHAALLLPARPSPVLGRELVYTGLTRARERLTLLLPPGGRATLLDALGRRVQRASGLAEGWDPASDGQASGP